MDHDSRWHRVTDTDADLLAAAETDAHSFRLFYDRYAVRAHGYFRGRGVDHHTAVDLTAETFAEAWRSLGRYADRGDGDAGPWLFGIARNVLSHAARHRAVATSARERLGMLATPPAEPGEIAVDGLDPVLEDALTDLPASARHAVQLRVVHGSSYEEISETLGCTPLAARLKVSRALAQLREGLTEEQRGEPA